MAQQFYTIQVGANASEIVTPEKPIRKCRIYSSVSGCVVSIGENTQATKRASLVANEYVLFDFQCANCGYGVAKLHLYNSSQNVATVVISVDEYGDSKSGNNEYFQGG